MNGFKRDRSTPSKEKRAKEPSIQRTFAFSERKFRLRSAFTECDVDCICEENSTWDGANEIILRIFKEAMLSNEYPVSVAADGTQMYTVTTGGRVFVQAHRVQVDSSGAFG